MTCMVRLLVLTLALLPALAKADCASTKPQHGDPRAGVEMRHGNHGSTHDASMMSDTGHIDQTVDHALMAHDDCDSQCSVCASCSPATNNTSSGVYLIPPPHPEQSVYHSNPLHSSSPPFRPPIYS